MSLDTRSKRASSVGLLLCAMLAPPLPDGTLSQADHQHIAVSYAGILAEPTATTVIATPWQLNTDGYLASAVELNTGGVVAAIELNTGGVMAAVELNTDGISVGS